VSIGLSSLVLMAGAVTSTVLGGLRWLRVAQREHYVAGSVARFARRWWVARSLNLVLFIAAVIGVVGVWWWPPIGWLILSLAVGPVGLSLRGTTSPLRWTSRLRRVAAFSGGVVIGGVALAIATSEPGWSLAMALLIPVVVDLALAVTNPLERIMSERWVSRAAAKLASSGAKVIAITGSYGKTTTKGYLHHLLSGHVSVVTTPASFNNRLGLARAINEHLIPGVEVFVAEMGTYAKGEIAALSEFVAPDVAVITAIGPVHLERFGSEEAIVEAKREILGKASVAVLNVDHPLLAAAAEQEEEDGRLKVIRVSGMDLADVSVVDGVLRIDGEPVGSVGPEVFGANLAAAVAAATQCGVPREEIARRLATLPVAPHRRAQSTSERGFVIIDDTYNSNPAGATAALGLLCSLPGDGRRVVVTPGMVELGSRQFSENAAFARAVAERASDLLVVGRTNQMALLEGAKAGAATVTVLSSRQRAVEWVRSRLGPGDAVLYENDLPDHYP
jgi:UDP-N-acetylmuramoyl-tripeptide--D-alanyl-D-alanine ligase